MAFCRQCRRRKGLTVIAIIAFFIPLATCFTVKRSNLPNSKRPMRQHEMITDKAHAPSSRYQSSASKGHDASGNTVNLYNRYMTLLESHPLVTKSISCGIVSALGDVLAQWIEAMSGQLPFTLNVTRLVSFFTCNTLFVGPFLHFWWGQLEQMGTRMDTKYNASKRLQTLTKVVLDQTVGVAVFFPAYFYAYELTEALVSWRAPVLATAQAKCAQELIPVLLMQYRVWPLVTFIIFAHVPQSLRVLAGNVVAVVWNAFLCTRVA